ncbi:thioesterase family protein [Deinococcus sp.]|uniref:acyl-CoA thioesterase n=1 Tax=Deinococcus sp. TaxID=47478 RepID=UPI00286D887F|nr:thioesterase family protein [Deinococcus sp.]
MTESAPGSAQETLPRGLPDASSPHFPLSTQLRVRWSEVDAQQVVFNGHYLMYADICFTEYFRAADIDQWNAQSLNRPDAAQQELDNYVVQASLTYRSPARFDDLLTLKGRISRLGTSSFTFECRMQRGETLLCTVELVSVNAHAGAAKPLPAAFREAVLAFESGTST